MKRNATLACQELYQLMADITSTKMTKPRKVKVYGYKSITIEDVTKKNFEGITLIAKAIPAEDAAQNEAIKQKAIMGLYQVFKDDPKIPGQIALRRQVAKTFKLEPEQIEAFFTQEEAPSQPATKTPTQSESPIPPTQPNAPTEATPLLSQTGQAAAVNVPKTF
jgi:hypothetical protein